MNEKHNVVIVESIERLDTTAATAFEATLREALEDGSNLLVLDLGSTTSATRESD